MVGLSFVIWGAHKIISDNKKGVVDDILNIVEAHDSVDDVLNIVEAHDSVDAQLVLLVLPLVDPPIHWK